MVTLEVLAPLELLLPPPLPPEELHAATASTSDAAAAPVTHLLVPVFKACIM
jgi:hypothetical protein